MIEHLMSSHRTPFILSEVATIISGRPGRPEHQLALLRAVISLIEQSKSMEVTFKDSLFGDEPGIICAHWQFN